MIRIASGLARILDCPIDRWGSIREAIPAFEDDLVQEALELYRDEEFNVLFGHCLGYERTAEVDLDASFDKSAQLFARETGLSVDESATLLISFVRVWIRTSETLGYQY